jgi:hypothetical protein
MQRLTNPHTIDLSYPNTTGTADPPDAAITPGAAVKGRCPRMLLSAARFNFHRDKRSFADYTR